MDFENRKEAKDQEYFFNKLIALADEAEKNQQDKLAVVLTTLCAAIRSGDLIELASLNANFSRAILEKIAAAKKKGSSYS